MYELEKTCYNITMKTITSNKSLIYFEQNSNKSNIGANGVEQLKLLLKPCYVDTFRKIANDLRKTDKMYGSFVTYWQAACREACKNVKQVVTDYVKVIKKIDNDTKDDIKRVVIKFRGNLAEILVEAMFINNKFQGIGTSEDYIPVDPSNEKYVDASTKSSFDGMPIGIQVKNYDNNVRINDKLGQIHDKDNFCHAAAQHGVWINDSNIVSDEQLASYRSMPRQFIISFTDTSSKLVRDYEKTVTFIGPRDIDKLCLQGNTKYSPLWKIFDDIANEIEKLA